MAEKYLTNKDCAKILCDLYKECFNRPRIRNEKIFIPIRISGKSISRYTNTSLTFEEIWAYENKILFSESLSSNFLEMKREWHVPKKTFLIVTCTPIYKLIYETDEVYAEKLYEFVVEEKLAKDLFQNLKQMRKWFTFESESIRTKDAEKIVENIKDFFVSRNC